MFSERFGAIFDTILTFKDFRMFRLKPEEGTLVLGFGMAFQIDMAQSMEPVPIRPRGGNAHGQEIPL
jgi:putative heme iron utilization protein